MRALLFSAFIALAGFGTLFMPTQFVQAQALNPFGGQLSSTANVIDSDHTMQNLDVLIVNMIKAVMSLLGIILLILIIYAAFLWMTAAGNAPQVAKAKTILTNAIIGLILVMTAYGITLFVVTALSGGDTGTLAGNLDTSGESTNLSDQSFGVILGSLISSFLGILGIIFLLLTLYSGFLWMTAAGNPTQVDKAKRLMTQAIIGLVIMLSSYGVTRFVINQLDDAGLAEDGNDVEINLFGTYHMIRACLDDIPHGGKIINITSGMGLEPRPGNSSYSAAKAGAHMLTRCLSLEIWDRGIDVNDIIPGLVATTNVDWAKDRSSVESVLAEFEGKSPPFAPSERVKHPDELGELVLWVASMPAGGPTGQSFSLARRPF